MGHAPGNDINATFVGPFAALGGMLGLGATGPWTWFRSGRAHDAAQGRGTEAATASSRGSALEPGDGPVVVVSEQLEPALGAPTPGADALASNPARAAAVPAALPYIPPPMRSRPLPSTILRRFLPPLAWAAACAAPAAALAQASAAAAAAGGAGEAAQVLVIGGTDPYLPAFVAIDGAMRSAVAERHQRSVLWMHESIDTARFGGASGPALAELLARKYERVRIDAVVLVTEAAVDFHLRYRQQLWPATPAVFHSVAPAYARRLAPGNGLSGIQAEVDFSGALRNAMALQPQAKRVLVVGGVSPFDDMQLAGARAALARLEGGLPVEYLVGRSPREAAARLASETAATIVLYAGVLRDAERQV